VIGTVLDFALSVLKLWEQHDPDSAINIQQRINKIKEEYHEEMAKPYSSIDAARLDQLEHQLRDLGRLFRSAVQGPNVADESK
jgi:hypothetical protein